MLSLLGLLFIVRTVGPDSYGIYNAAAAITGYLQIIGNIGVRMYLIRLPDPPPQKLLDSMFWWLMFVGTALSLLAMPVVLLVGYYWMRDAGFVPIAITLCVMMPLGLMIAIPTALLERALEYKRTAWVELLSQLGFYVVGIPLALMGYGAWALVGGHGLSLLIALVGFYVSAGYVPKWCWDRAQLRDTWRYIAAQTTATWIYELRQLVPPMLLLPLAGASAVGYLAIANRLLDILSFAQTAVQRVSAPVYAHVQKDRAKLMEAIYRSAQAQMLALGVVCIGFVPTAHLVLPILFGEKWDVPSVMAIFGLMTTQRIFSAIFGAQMQSLQILKKNKFVVFASTLSSVNLFLLTALLLFLTPESGRLIAFGIANLVTHGVNYLVIHVATVRFVARPVYRMNLLWAAALSGAMLNSLLGWWTLLGLAVFLLPPSWREIKSLSKEVRGR